MKTFKTKKVCSIAVLAVDNTSNDAKHCLPPLSQVISWHHTCVFKFCRSSAKIVCEGGRMIASRSLDSRVSTQIQSCHWHVTVFMYLETAQAKVPVVFLWREK